MDYRKYIERGILQDYCLGLLSAEENTGVEEMCKLHPQIREELVLIQNSLGKLSQRSGAKPRAGLKAAIWNILQSLSGEENISLENLPVITKHSDSRKWLSLVKPLLPGTLVAEDEFTMLLQDTGKVMQKVYKSRKNYADEVHEDIFEGILILEGKCTCKIGEGYYDFEAGNFISIPLHIVHNLTVTSPSITFVVQHLAA